MTEAAAEHTAPIASAHVVDQVDRADRLASRFEIQDAVANYCGALDSRDPEMFLATWHEDAVFEVNRPPTLVTGRDEILALAQDTWKRWWQTHHWAANHVVSFEAPHCARGRVSVSVQVIDHEGRMRVGAGTFTDIYERRDGIWRVARRTTLIHYLARLPEVRVPVSRPGHNPGHGG
jgi:gamma-hexachlorocyclohexane dehydrochlorinase